MNRVEYNRLRLIERGVENYLKDEESILIHQLGHDEDDVRAAILAHEKWLLTEGVQNGQILDFRGDGYDDLDFSDLFLDKAIFCGSSLTNTDFSGSSLKDTDFNEADLFNADLSYTQLNGADLQRAKLLNAKFHCADISGAKISLNDITIEQLGQCLYTPELALMIQAKYHLMKAEKLNTNN